MSEERLTWREGFRDVSFFWWLFGVIAGAPSIVSIVQSVFVERRLITPLQWAQDRYDEALHVLGQLMEPYLVPLVHRFGDLFGWELTLYPHWRPLFVLIMVSVVAHARNNWNTGFHVFSLFFILLGGFLVLMSCVAAALMPLDGPWWSGGVIAALPITAHWLGWGLADAFEHATMGDWQSARWTLSETPDRMLSRSVLAFGLGAAASVFPPLAAGAGLAGLGAALMLLAMADLTEGMINRDTFFTRMSLTVLGAFMGAGLIYALDGALRVAGG